MLAAELKITPANGSHDVNPAGGITRHRHQGKGDKRHSPDLGRRGVRALGGDRQDLAQHRTLDTSQTYTVTATGTGTGGSKITTTSTFRTLSPTQTFSAEIYEGSGQTYGVGMPIMLTFSQPITNKAAVERSLELTTSKPVIGAWYWDGDEQLYFRPRDYWPAYTTVSFTAT